MCNSNQQTIAHSETGENVNPTLLALFHEIAIHYLILSSEQHDGGQACNARERTEQKRSGTSPNFMIEKLIKLIVQIHKFDFLPSFAGSGLLASWRSEAMRRASSQLTVSSLNRVRVSLKV